MIRIHSRGVGYLAAYLASIIFAGALQACGGDGYNSDFGVQPVANVVTTPPTVTISDISTTNVDLGTPVSIAAVLRAPTSGNAHVGIVVMHPYSKYSTFQGCSYLAQRGFAVLCVDSTYTNRQFDYYGYEQHVPAIKAAINYLRAQPKITKVLLFGHSMGAPMMAFYQNVAENGSKVCTGTEKLMPCVTANLSSLPVADCLILFDAHLGESLATYTYIDPAVVNNTFGARTASLDMFASTNGYNPTTNGATYSDAFKTNFLAAQAARNDQLTSQALGALITERANTANPAATGDDIPFTVVGATSARLWQPDLSLVECTQAAHVLLSHDGTRPVQQVCSVRPPSGGATAGLSQSGSTVAVNVHVWLGAHAMRTAGNYTQNKTDIAGVDYTSTATSTVGNIGGVTRPLLIVSNSGHYFVRPDEIVFDTAKMADKTYAIEEGSIHGGTECTACEAQANLAQPPSSSAFGYYGDTFTRTMNYMAEWVLTRY